MPNFSRMFWPNFSNRFHSCCFRALSCLTATSNSRRSAAISPAPPAPAFLTLGASRRLQKRSHELGPLLPCCLSRTVSSPSAAVPIDVGPGSARLPVGTDCNPPGSMWARAPGEVATRVDVGCWFRSPGVGELAHAPRPSGLAA